MNEVIEQNAVSWIFPGAVPLQQLQRFKEVAEVSFVSIAIEEGCLEFYGAQAHTIMCTDWANENKFQYIQVLDDVFKNFKDKAGWS
ncbi:hypothetical protein HP548_00685 [Paenibacillus taichungensis]|uniref:Uncharacterized protein n=2 Tax=Paenibacillus taichungensis TaxID=484184 RepID=A0ABX2MCD1_9BACL|nr:hypothetical protein [Paenibacillus taichungensis]